MDFLQTLLCRFDRHDWVVVDTYDALDLTTEDGEIAIRYEAHFPLEWRCRCCGETKRIDKSQLELRDADDNPISA